MREIKFRAISYLIAFGKSDSSFVYGYLMYDVDGFPRICEVNSIGTITSRKCKKGTEGQFTGLKDKNGVDVYEGDILDNGTGNYIGVVTFENGSFLHRNNPLGYFVEDGAVEDNRNDIDDKITLQVAGPEYWSVVLGNIHQNPELL